MRFLDRQVCEGTSAMVDGASGIDRAGTACKEHWRAGAKADEQVADGGG